MTHVRTLVTLTVLALLTGLLGVAPPATAAGPPRGEGLGAAVTETAPRASAPGSGCQVLRQRLTRAQHRVRVLRADLRRARARGAEQRVRRLRAEVRQAESRRARLRAEVRLACDRTPPETRFLAGPATGAVVQGSRVTLRFGSSAADVAGYHCSLDGAPWRGCAGRDGRVERHLLDVGRHTLRVRAVDRARNADRTPLTRTFSTHFFASLDAGGDRTCGLRPTGTIRCWGAAFPDGATPPAGSFSFVGVGPGDHACAVRSADDVVVCWGADDAGQASPPPGTTVGTNGKVYVGRDHTCTSGTCWGDDTDGESTIPAGSGVTGVGDDLTCGNSAAGPRCWGDVSGGQDDVPGGTDVVTVVGEDSVCGVGDLLQRSGRCWGPAPAPSWSWDNFLPYVVSVGGDHMCVAGEVLFCLGSDTFGQATVPDPPSFIESLAPYGPATAGRNHTCAIRADDVAVCWGDDRVGQASPRPA